MKKLLFLSAALLFILSACNTGSQANGNSGGTYTGKLAIKALCMNYTFTLVKGDIDTSLINGSWIDESTGKTYENAFGISNPCDLPEGLKEGDEFSFKIDTAKGKNCAVCMAYYPTPPRKLSIKVLDK
jgi:hypothetical protein